MRTSFALAGLASLLIAASAQAQDSKPQVMVDAMPKPADCSFTKAMVCKADAACEEAKAVGDIPLPARVLVHYQKKVIAATSSEGIPHVSSIDSLATSGDNLTLQGVDGGAGWVLQTSRTEDGATFTAVTHESVLLSFGTCKTLE
ncbi:MAG: hypothetical protein AB7S41_17250 [Parvibaculaceae bacterium]